MASFEFEYADRGGIGMSIHAESEHEVYNACVGAVGRVMWGELPEEVEIPIVWYGFDEGSLAVALINELLYQHQLRDFCFSRFATERVEEVEELDEKVWKGSARQLKIFGKAYGVIDKDQSIAVKLPIYAALLPGMKFKCLDDGSYHYYCILDDVGGDPDQMPKDMA